MEEKISEKEKTIEVNELLVGPVLMIGSVCAGMGLIYLFLNFRIYIWIWLVVSLISFVIGAVKHIKYKVFMRTYILYSCLYILLCSNMVTTLDTIIHGRPGKEKIKVVYVMRNDAEGESTQKNIGEDESGYIWL